MASSASNTTHESTTDPDALLTRKGAGKEAKLAFSAHVLMENRHGLCVDVSVARATGYAEREEALRMVRRQRANGIAAEDRWAPTRRTTRPTSSRRCAPRASRRTSHSTSRRTGGRTSGWPHDAPPRLRAQPAGAEADRRDLRLGQDDRRLAEDPVPRARTQRLLGLPRGGDLQLGPHDQAPAGPCVSPR